MNPQPGLLAGAKSARECVCARTLDGSKSSSMACKGEGAGRGGDSMRRREGGEQPCCTIKIDSKRSDVLKKRNKGLETSTLFLLLLFCILFLFFFFYPGIVLSYPLHTWRHGLREVGLEIEKPLRRHPTGARITYVGSTFQRVGYDCLFELHGAAWLCF